MLTFDHPHSLVASHMHYENYPDLSIEQVLVPSNNFETCCIYWNATPPGVLPCLPYSQQTKMKRRGNISLRLVAEMCVNAGFNHIITIDLHSKESQVQGVH